MLRRDVVEAAAAGRFHIHAVATVDEAIELLTGVAVGAPETEGSLDQRVAQRIKHLAELRRKYAKKAGLGVGGRDENGDE
jgi:predicted ATP-dependent protease